MINALIQFIAIFRYSVIISKHLFVIQKLRLIRSTSFGFAQNTMYDFQNTVLNS